MNLRPLELTWKARSVPLPVAGCLLEGSAVQAFQHKLKREPRPRLRVSALENGVMIALGTDPPWVEQAVFLGRTGNLYTPTLWEPNLPVAWLEAGLARLGEPPWLLLPDGRAIGLSKAAVIL